MKELSVYQKIAFAVLCVGAFTNTFLLLPQLTVLRLGVAMVLAGLFFAERRRMDASFYAVAGFYLLYIVYTLLITLTNYPALTFSNVSNFLFILLLLLSASWIFSATPSDSLRLFYWICCANLVVSVVLATVEMTTGWHLPTSNMLLQERVMIVAEHNHNYPTGFFNNKNDFAIVIALTFCYIMAYRVRCIQNRKRWLDFVFLALCVACIMMARCRTSLIAVAVFCLFLQRRFIFRHKVFFGVTGAVCLLGAAVVFLFFADHSISIRENLYLYSFVSLFDSYGLGFGLGGDRLYYAGLDNYELFEYITNTHSYLLNFLLTSGILFFAGYLFILFYLMRRIALEKGRDEFWAMIPLYVFLMFAPSASTFFWIHYLFFASFVGYVSLPSTPKTPILCD